MAKLITRKKLGKTIQWIGVVGFFVCFANIFVTDYFLLNGPLVPRPSTGNVVQWNYKGYVRYITQAEDNWDRHTFAPTFLMFCLIALGLYLNSKEK
jgi:hypothetical protein